MNEKFTQSTVNAEAEPVSPLSVAKAAILTDEQYREHPFANEGPRTYVYELTDGDRTLTYFGAKHIHDPRDPMFEELRQVFQKAAPDLVFLEGLGEYVNDHKDEVRGRAKSITPEEAKRRGENFYTLKLAVDAGSDFESPEFRREDEIHKLERIGFSHQDIFDFYFYRSVHGYQRQVSEMSMEACLKYIQPYMHVLRTASGWPEEELNAFYKIAVEALDIQDQNKYSRLVDPIPWEGQEQGITNEIAHRLSRLRDEYGLERIAEGLKHHKRLFVTYGSTHAVRLEPALRKLFETQTKSN